MLTGLTLTASGMFSVSTPYWIVIVVLFTSGIIRSLQFSTLGALTYVDVPPEQSSCASSLSAMTIQLTMSLSVGIAAALLSLIMSIRGHATVAEGDVALVMGLAGLLCAVSGLVYRKLSPQAGVAVYAARSRSSVGFPTAFVQRCRGCSFHRLMNGRSPRKNGGLAVA